MNATDQNPARETERCLFYLRQFGVNAFSSCLLYQGVHHFFLTGRDGCVGYLDVRSILVSIGEPVCAVPGYGAAAAEFIEHARGQGKSVAFVGVGQAFVNATWSLGVTKVRLGEDLIFDVPSYAPRGDRAKKVRSACNQFWRRGGRVREYRPSLGRDDTLEQQIAQVIARWLRAQSKYQMHLLDVDLFCYAEHKRYFLAELKDAPVALLSCLPIFARQGYLLEDLIREPQAPNGATEALVLAAILAIRAEGSKMATFGLSPRPDLAQSNLRGLGRAIALVGIRTARALSGLDHLYHYRKKFHPGISEPSYLVKYPAGLRLGELWGMLRAFAFGGGRPGRRDVLGDETLVRSHATFTGQSAL